jgi:hypothetical protein
VRDEQSWEYLRQRHIPVAVRLWSRISQFWRPSST